MRWIILGLLLCAWTPITQKHETLESVDQEFSGQENDLQSKQFTVKDSTPNLNDLKDAEMIIVSTNTAYTRLMFRYNQEIWMVNASCVTVRR